MTGKLGDQGLDTLEERFQALRDQLGVMPEACRPELETALQDLSQAIAALRADQEAVRSPRPDPPGGPPALPDRFGETILQHVFSATPDLLIVLDRDLNVIMSNWHGHEFVSEEVQYEQPKCYRVFMHRDRPCEDCQVLEIFATGQPVKFEKDNPVDGRVREVSAYPIRDESGRVVLVTEHVRDVQERHLAEQAIRESAATLRTLIEANPESLFLLDTRGVILAASHVAAQRLGKSLAEIIGTDLHGMLPPEVSQKRFKIMQGVVATGQPARFEDVRGDFYFDSSVTPIFNQGKVVQVAVLGVDITDRKHAEEALRKSEARFRALFATAQDTIFIKDRSFRYTQVNPAMGRLFSRPAAEIIGKTDSDLVGAADTERIQKQDQRVLNGEVVKGVHTLTVQGVPITFHYIKAPLHDDAGEIVGICGIARDITDLKRTEAALEESEERFRMLFEHAPDAYILADMQGEIIDCNQAAEELAGYGREELIGNNFACLPWLDFRQQVRLADLLAQAARGEVMGPVDFTLTRKDGGEVTAEGMNLPLYIQGQNLVLTIVRDITARKQAEAELKLKHLELQETAQWLEQSRNMLQLIIESIPVRVFWKDRDLRYLGCNTLFARDAGFNQPQQLLGQDDFAMGWRNQADLYRTDDLQIMESRRPKMNIVEPQTTPAGAKIWLKTSKVPLQMPNGEVFGVLGVYEDITTHEQAEEALRESEARFRAIFEYAPVGICMSELRGQVLQTNQALQALLGYSADEFRKMSIQEITHPEDLTGNLQLQEELLAGKRQHYSTEKRCLRKDGGIVWAQVMMTLLRDGRGEPRYLLATVVDCTARKQAEAELRQSEQRFRDITENAAEWIWEVDPLGKYTYSSPVVGQLLGYKPDEILGKYFYDFFLPGECEDLKNAALAAFAAKQPFRDFINPNLHKDGRTVWLSTSGIPILDEQGNLLGYRGADIDITARKQAEEALRESEARFRAIFENAPVGISMTDLPGRLLQTNRVLQALLGYTAEELRGREASEIIHPEDRPENARLGMELMAGNHRHYSMDNRLLRKDGEIIWGQVTVTLLRDARGEPEYFVGTVIDITAQKQAEAELRQSEQRFRLMAETIQDVFWIATPRIGKTVYVSPGFEYIWGRTSEALYRNPKLFLETVHPEDRERVKSEIIAARERSIPWSHEYRIIRPDGAVRWIQNRGFPIRDDQGRVILFTGVATDITERKAMEGQLLQAQKMEAVGRLAGGVAHDFNNLLMAITGYGELMRAKVLKDDPLYGHLENILKAGDRAAALTQQLLTFSRQKIVHPEVIDLNRVVLDLEPMLRRLIGEDLHLEVVTDRKAGVVKADPGQMGQIIMNLVVNARDAMPQGGRLTLKTAAVDLTEGCHSRFGVAPPGPYVMLVVQDTGIGMDEATQAHVFEPFFTTKAPGKGTGLGLSTVYGIVKQSGGYLDLESSPGAGSTFTIYLPRLEAIAVPPKAKVPITASFRGEETIMLVEDEDVLRSLLAKFLRLYGYAVLEARHGGEALLTCERHPGPIHLMVTDVVMPQMSGRELADRLTPLRPEMKVLFISGYTEDALVQHGVAALSVAFLQKPFKPIELARRVHAVLHPPVSQ